jgi:putative lipoic acid-binding regulatory protein
MKTMNQSSSPNASDRPEITYPCTWTYKVIGEDRTELREVITAACSPNAVLISHSHSSSKGKYHSVNAELVVPDETVRLRIYETLKNSAAVKIVL